MAGCCAAAGGQDAGSTIRKMPEMIREWERAFLQTLVVCMGMVIFWNRLVVWSSDDAKEDRWWVTFTMLWNRAQKRF